MKIYFSSGAKKRAKILANLFTLGIITFCILGYFICLQMERNLATAREVNKFEVRSNLLMEATDSTGVCKPEQAAEVWASGLQKRSAALQYTVMTKALKDKYAKQLETTFPNWVTGVSSPWVDSFTITKAEIIDDNTQIYHILFKTMTSAGPAGDYNAALTIIKEDCFRRVAKIEADKELSVYTGFQP